MTSPVPVFYSWRTERCFRRASAARVRKLALRAAELAGTGLDEENPLGVSFLSSRKMTEVNWDYLEHTGDTDVICFNYREADDGFSTGVDILICPAFALREARKRNLPYGREVALYLVHGLLHAAGYDDLKPELKRKMRRAEKRVMTVLENEFNLTEIFQYDGEVTEK
ncbi:MAG: rRNA maturation RNase YbeY [Lentisphaeria bacterium]|nr:rRNA maturation RNase YbeY [Lentisphaeria bacterium]